MFECSCGKKYKYASGLNNHKEKCGGGGGGGAAAAVVAEGSDDTSQNPCLTVPLTSLPPTENVTKEELEQLEKRKQSRMNAILQAQKEEKAKKEAQKKAEKAEKEAKKLANKTRKNKA